MSKHNSLLRTVGFYTVAVGCMCTLWIMFMHALGCGAQRVVGDISRCMGEMALLSSPYWFAGKRWRIILALLPLLMAVVFIPNLLYYRFWGDILGMGVVFMKGNVNADLISSGWSLATPSDLWYAVLGVFPLCLYFLLGAPAYRFRLRTGCMLTGCSLILFVFSGFVNVRGVVKNSPDSHSGGLSYVEAAASLWRYERLNQWKSLSRGILWHILNMARDIGSLNHAGVTLTPEERERIAAFIVEVPEWTPDSVVMANRGRNVVMIVVESLNSSVIDTRVGGVEVTPTLNALCGSGEGVQCRKVVPQIKSGGSSDGQILLNTGLLPPSLGASALMYPDVLPDLPSLPRFLPGHDAVCVFATDGKWWSERGVQRSLGYDSTYVLDDYHPKVDSLGRDGGMFSFALDLIRSRLREGKSDRPLLLQLITGSMHIPFRDDAAPNVAEFGHLPASLRDYYTVSRYFDSSLAFFLQGLKELGLYDDTVVIIASDHSESVAGDTSGEGYAFYGVFGGGISADIKRVVGQMNLFPTTLYMLGVAPSVRWHGLGPDIFTLSLDSALTPYGDAIGDVSSSQREAYAIADLIWRGDYFSKR